MRLNKYVALLQDIADQYGDLEVIYSKDDEGNGYQEVHYDPSPGNFEDGEFDNTLEDAFNAVCVN